MIFGKCALDGEYLYYWGKAALYRINVNAKEKKEEIVLKRNENTEPGNIYIYGKYLITLGMKKVTCHIRSESK